LCRCFVILKLNFASSRENNARDIITIPWTSSFFMNFTYSGIRREDETSRNAQI